VFDQTPSGVGPSTRSRGCNTPAKNLRALPWLRTMCGSEEFLQEESQILRAMLGYVGKDGLVYLLCSARIWMLRNFALPIMPLSLRVGIHDADRRERSVLPPGDHSEYGDLNLAGPECPLRVPESVGPGSSEGGLGCTTEGSNTHKTETRVVRYPWHPWYGRPVGVRGIRKRHDLKVLFCTACDAHEFPVLEVPEWMFDSVICGRLERAERARVDGRALRERKSLLESATPRREQAVLEAQHHPKLSGGADAKEIQVESTGPVPGDSTEPGGTPGSSSEGDSSLGADAAAARGTERRAPLRSGGEP
jgi:hypothetical protein